MGEQPPAIDVAAVTHVGHVRRRNEDCAVVAGTVLQADDDSVAWHGDEGPVLVAVLDGLGGHPDGDIASRLAARALAAGDPADVRGTIVAAHRAVIDAVRDGTGRPSMGTTAVVASVTTDEVRVGSVGDSPALRVGPDGLEPVVPSDRERFGGLTAFLGDTHAVALEPHVQRLRRDRDLRLLLASDGLTDVLPREEVAQLARPGTAGEAAGALVAATLDRRAHDNVTVVVLDVAASPHPEA